MIVEGKENSPALLIRCDKSFICVYTLLGVPTAKVAVEFARRCGLDLPIFFAVNAILSGDLKMEVRLTEK